MNRYEGLNLVDLLDLMHDLVRPEPVSWAPQTVGWTIVAVWLAALVVILTWYGYQRWRNNRYRRDALTELASIEAEVAADPSDAAGQIAALLKRTALATYPRTTVANLYGNDWARFLCESSVNDPEVKRAAEQIAAAAYRTDVDGASLVEPARRWIKVHRA